MPCSCKCFIPATNLKMHDSFMSNLSKDSRLHSFEDIVYLSLPSPFVFLSTTGPLLIPPPITSSVKSLHRLLKRQKHLIKTFIACRPKCACCVLSRQKFFCFWPLLRVQIAHIVLQTLSHTHPHG